MNVPLFFSTAGIGLGVLLYFALSVKFALWVADQVPRGWAILSYSILSISLVFIIPAALCVSISQ